MKVLAFDIGIRNLAWCFLEVPELTAKPIIRGWQNFDLLAGTGTEEAKAAAKVKCSVCQKSLATFQFSGTPTCVRHCPTDRPALKDLSGVILKKLPGLAGLKALIPSGTTIPKRATKADYIKALSGSYSLPIEKLKVVKAVETDMMRMHDAIRSFVSGQATLFAQATHVLLENQPVLKNPTMKTVQVLLFATLRDILHVPGQVYKLVHAGKKVKGKAAGDAGYKDRKDASESKVEELLGAEKVAESIRHKEMFTAQAKKSDLADAFCMCWDFTGTAAQSQAPKNT